MNRYVLIFCMVMGLSCPLLADIYDSAEKMVKSGDSSQVAALIPQLIRGEDSKKALDILTDIVTSRKLTTAVKMQAVMAMESLDQALLLKQLPRIIRKIKDDSLRSVAETLLSRLSKAEAQQRIDTLKQQNDLKACQELADILKEEALDISVHQLALKTLLEAAPTPQEKIELLDKASGKIDNPGCQVMLMEALVQLSDDSFAAKALTSRNPVMLGAGFLKLSQQDDTTLPEGVDLDKLTASSDYAVIRGLVMYLVSFHSADNEVPERYATALQTLLESDNPQTTALSIEALLQSKMPETQVLAWLKKYYRHPDWMLRLKIIDYVAAQPKTDGQIKFLLECMGAEQGRLRSDIALHLSKILGVDNVGPDVREWKNLISKMGSDLGEITQEFVRAETAYYGLKVISKRIVFVLDKTGSMLQDNKMPAAKEELCRALHELDSDLKERMGAKYLTVPPDQRVFFTIQAFSTDVQWWKLEMVPATKKNIEAACEWVMGLQASDSTYTDLALEGVYEFAKNIGTSAIKKGPQYLKNDMRPDTIYLVTDGMPSNHATGPRANKNPYDVIDEIVDKLFQDTRITINCIGILSQSPNRFLEKVAGKTGGQTAYVDPLESVDKAPEVPETAK